MSNTIPGGAYQNPDGTWVNANGKPIADRVVSQFLEQQDEKEAALRDADRIAQLAQLQQVTGLTSFLQPPVTAVTPRAAATPPPSEPSGDEGEQGTTGDDDEPAAPKRSAGRSRKS